MLTRDRREIAALLCGNPADLEIREGNSPLETTLCARRENGTIEALPCQDLLLFTPFQPETDSPYGVSLLRSMPFLTEILLKIYQATGMNWERMETYVSPWYANPAATARTESTRRNGVRPWPGSGAPPCRQANRAASATLWPWAT